MTRTDRTPIYERLDARFDEFVDGLSEYARVPTISAARQAQREGAEATLKILDRYGVTARLMDVPGGPPMVVGDVVVDPKLPTLILYNHYDVQPVDPLDEWKHKPFEPVVADGNLYARGVADTKGNVVAQALAQAAIREVTGTLPVNLRFMVEGEEEVG
ncbi:MAG: M20/M25/M40 family metallo-hydrolase, partial [Actinomycetota bacterium]